MLKTNKISLVAIAAFAIGVVLTMPVSAAQDGNRDLATYQCKDVMRVGGEDRVVAVAVMQGYLMGKADTTVFNVDVAQSANEKFIDYCLDHPTDKALDAMIKFAKYPLP